MRLVNYILLMLCLPGTALHVTGQADSLKQELTAALLPQDKAKYALMLGNYYIYRSTDSAEYYFSQAREWIPGTGFDSLYIRIYERNSILAEQTGDFSRALELVRTAWTRVKQSGAEMFVNQMYILLGRNYAYLTQYDSAVYYWTLVLEREEQVGEKYRKWNPHRYLGQLYADLGDWTKAKYHFNQSLAYTRLEKRPKDYPYLLYVYMEACEKAGDLDMYSQLKDEYLAYKQEQGPVLLSLEHSTFSMLEPPAEFRQRMHSHLPYHISKKRYFSICDTYYRIGQTYEAEKNYPEAISSYTQMLLYADTIGYNSLRYNAHVGLYKAYRALHDYRNALQAHEQIFTLWDSILNIEKQKQLDELSIKYETADKEKQLAETTLALALADKKQQFLLMGLVSAMLLLGIAIYAVRTKNRSHRMEVEKNHQISTALREKDILLREIHHRVKNNLQMISALLYLHGKSVGDASAQEALMESQNRVQSMAIIHQNLYQHENLLGVSIKDYLDKLLQHLINSYNIEEHRIRIHKAIDVPQLDVDTVIPLALIINELVSNALKYAFRDGREGEIDIRLSDNGGFLHLQVRDNGIGLPEHFSVEQSSNFGLKLIDILCERLGASWTTASDNGTQITLSIPQKKAA